MASKTRYGYPTWPYRALVAEAAQISRYMPADMCRATGAQRAGDSYFVSSRLRTF